MKRFPALSSFLIAGLIVTSCSSITAPQPVHHIVMGDRICGREATQIYFGNNDDQLSLMAAQVLSGLSDKLQRCPKRQILLLAVSGNDGPGATAIVQANRLKIVGDILLSHNIAPSRLTIVEDGPLYEGGHQSPIGGVWVMTRR